MVIELKQLLQKLVDKTPNISHHMKEERAMALWAMVVDERISKHAAPLSVNKGVLTIGTENPVWTSELRFLKPEILKKLNERAGEKLFKDIKFKAGLPEGGLNG